MKSKTQELVEVQFPGVRTVTLAEQGMKLPIGVRNPSTGELSKDMLPRAWKTKQERELGKMKRANTNMGEYLSIVVAYMYDRVGPADWSKQEDRSSEQNMLENRAFLSRLYMADMFYMYTYLRSRAIGDSFSMKIRCANALCAWSGKWTGDLSTAEVRVVDDIAAVDWDYQLQDHFKIRGEMANSLRVSATLWNAIEGLAATGAAAESAAKISTVRASVVGINGAEGVGLNLNESELDEMSKFDLETLADEINERFLGVKMAIDESCPKCQTKIIAPIDWSYGSFFSASSR